MVAVAVARAGTAKGSQRPYDIIWTMPLNVPAPAIELPDLEGHLQRLSDYRGRIVVVNFWSAECPWSERADQDLMALLLSLGERAALLPVASNPNEPEELLRAVAKQRGLSLVLRDSDGKAADAYEAQTTPHAFVLDQSGILRYQGAVDDVTFRRRTVTRWYVREAVQALLDGQLPPVPEAPPYGCAIVRHI